MVQWENDERKANDESASAESQELEEERHLSRRQRNEEDCMTECVRLAGECMKDCKDYNANNHRHHARRHRNEAADCDADCTDSDCKETCAAPS